MKAYSPTNWSRVYYSSLLAASICPGASTMAPPDPEKSAVEVTQNDAPPWPLIETTRVTRRRQQPYWAAFVVLFLLLAVGIVSPWRPAAASSATKQWLLRFNPAHSESTSQAIRSRVPTPNPEESATTTSSAVEPTRTVLKTFEVDQPVLMPDGPAESDGSTRDGKDYSPELCTVLLMRHDFAWSYGAPFVGKLNDVSFECF